MIPSLRSFIGSWPGEVDLNMLPSGGNIAHCLLCRIVAWKCYGTLQFKQIDIWHIRSRPDLISIDLTSMHAFLIDIAIPGDGRIFQKYQHYTDLKLEIQKMWPMKASVVPITLVSLGSMPTCLKGALQSLNIYYANLIPKLHYWAPLIFYVDLWLNTNPNLLENCGITWPHVVMMYF